MDIHSSLLPIAASALDALSLNQMLLAKNIANVNNQDYVSSRLDFSSYMDSILENEQNLTATDSSLAYVERNSATVNADLELAAMSENLQRFKAIVDVMNRQSEIMQLAMKGRTGS